MSDTNRNYSLDVIKIVCTVLIVLHHYQQTTGVRFQYINFFGGRFYVGNIVELFFILSGFFIVKYISRIQQGLSFRSFFLPRYLRLLPLMTISVGVFQILSLYYDSFVEVEAEPVRLVLYRMVMTMLGAWSAVYTSYTVNSPIWYVSVLLVCYILFYFVIWVSYKSRFPVLFQIIFYISLICAGMTAQQWRLSYPFFSYTTGRGYAAFFTGVIVGMILPHIKDNTKVYWLVICIVTEITAMFCIDVIPLSLERKYLVFVYYPSLVILFHHPVLVRFFSSQHISTVGKISFDVYVWHASLLKLIDIINKKTDKAIPVGQVSSMLIFLVIAFLFGTFSYYCIECPINRRLQPFLKSISSESKT